MIVSFGTAFTLPKRSNKKLTEKLIGKMQAGRGRAIAVRSVKDVRTDEVKLAQ